MRLLEYLRKGDTEHINQDAMKEVSSFLDLCEQHDFLRGSLLDRYSPQRLKGDLARAIKDYFRKIHYINDLREPTGLLPVNSEKSPHRKPIVEFLAQLLHDHCKYNKDHTGVDLCFVTTNYDYCVESWIQESTGGDAIIDGLYRGFTPSHINGEENTQYLMDRPFSLKLLKLNGGFEITESSSGFAIDYRQHTSTP